MNALVIHPTTGPELRDISTRLQVLQHIVGGYLETKNTPVGTAVFNEDGLRLRLPINLIASKMLGFAVVGTVIIFGHGTYRDDFTPYMGPQGGVVRVI